MNDKFSLKICLISLSIAAIVGWIISYFTDFSFLAAFILSIVGMGINGIIIGFEDKDNKPDD